MPSSEEKEPYKKMANTNSNGFEIKRKIAHVLFGILGLLLLIFEVLSDFQIFLILCIGILTSFIAKKTKIPVVSYFLDTFDRKNEKDLPGQAVIFAVAGSLLALRLFSQPIALASISILIFADPLSHVIGKLFGRTPSLLDKKKNVEGHIAGALISSLLACFFVPFYLAFIGALTAMLFESLIIEIQKTKLNDNLLIPLAAGTAMIVAMRFFG